MDYKYIEQLIERYFNAETTLQEEQILHTFFAQTEELPEELARYAPLFTLSDNKERLSDDFDQRILSLIAEDTSHVSPLTSHSTPVKAREIRLGERLRPLFKAAAIVAILITIGNAVNQSLEAVEVWEQPQMFAEEQQQTESAVAIEGVSIDSATLYGQAIMADTIQADTIGIHY